MAQRQTDKASADQSARFIEAAKKAGVDETGREFERAFKRIVKPKKAKRSRAAPQP